MSQEYEKVLCGFENVFCLLFQEFKKDSILMLITAQVTILEDERGKSFIMAREARDSSLTILKNDA